MFTCNTAYALASWCVDNGFAPDHCDANNTLYFVVERNGRSDDEIFELARAFQVLWSMSSADNQPFELPRVKVKIVETSD